jgi:REP element-mobilizing transposase RayT
MCSLAASLATRSNDHGTQPSPATLLMPLAHHSIFSMYGFWLPNDPRGSGSDYIAAWELYRYGKATKVLSQQSVAAIEHDRAARLAAKQSLRYPPVEIDGRQAVAIVGGFGEACAEGGYHVHACAVLPDHVHLVLGIHQRDIRVIVGHLKSRATRALKASGLSPGNRRSVWGAHGWNVYLDTAADVERAIRYVEENPIKEGKRAQHWSFVTPFESEVAERTASQGRAAKRRIGGAALRSHQEKARRKRRG